ncbi:MAG: hypothetical protein N4A65_15425 [Cohaesibacter sp.]|jgi:hypothetical protein|nr:hypothetical protein [Cohaesibacter sp.]
MKTGLYKIQFQTSLGNGDGVVYMKDGKIWGGDSTIYYTGEYTAEGETLSASVTTGRHAGAASSDPSVFGIDNVNITLSGKISENLMTVVGQAREAPGVQFDANLAFICD